MDYQRIAADFLRALRGKRSQTAFCRRLGYKSNVAYTWESGRGFPTAARSLEIASQLKVDVDGAFRRFYLVRTPPSWLGTTDVTSPQGVAAFLSDLKGNTSIVELAKYCDKSRFAVSRWLKGETEPKLPEFFELIECTSLRLIDFIETLVDPRDMSSIRARWEMLGTARRLAYDAPWTQAVLRVLELEQYQQLPEVPPGWIAARIGISLMEEQRCLELLHQTQQIKQEAGKWHVVQVLSLDMRKEPEQAARLRSWWGRVAVDRVSEGRTGMMYNLFSVSEKDMDRLRELNKAYFAELRAIVAQSEPMQRVGLATVQLLDLGEGPGTLKREETEKP